MQAATPTSPIPRKSLWAGRIISTLIVLFLLFDVVLKLVKPGFVVEAKTRLGYSENLRSPNLDTQDHGWMYSRSFQDPDGHIWEILFMDESQIPASP